jgi:adenylosuccinate lyase
MLEIQLLTAISPIDGRYRNKVDGLALYFSEYALIRYRVMVEVEYFIALCELPLPQLSGFDQTKFPELREIHKGFQLEDAEKVKSIESVTNHDVKAVEYFIKEKFDALGLQEYKEFIHFGLTSQDINNTAVPASLRDAVHDIYYPLLEELIEDLDRMAASWKDIAMLAKTHGQPASPTRLGKKLKFLYIV